MPKLYYAFSFGEAVEKLAIGSSNFFSKKRLA